MEYRITRLPESAEELSAEVPELASSPAGAVAACLAALNIMAGNPREGKKAFEAIHPEVSPSSLRLAEDQLSRAPWIPGSYFMGTSPVTGYRIPDLISISLSVNLYSGSEGEGSLKYFVECSGADSPRPVTVKRREDGSWYAHEWSSLIVGIKEPV